MLTRAPLEDVGLPFWCDWGNDWDERCYTDNTASGARARLRAGSDGLDGRADNHLRVERVGLTGVVSDWATGAASNHGVLLKLPEEEENYGVSGPYFASASFGLPAYRTCLVVSNSVPATGVVP